MLTRIIRHKAFIGGSGSRQSVPFKAAVQQFLHETPDAQFLEENILTCTDVKRREFTEKDFVDFYQSDCEAHYFVSHLHQNTMQSCRWNMPVLQVQLERLRCHLGYPYTLKLLDSSFTQDKFEINPYLGELANKTFKVPFSLLDDDGIIGNDILNFIIQFLSEMDEGAGWVVKIPYTTASEGVTFCHSKNDIQRAIKAAWDMYGEILDYITVQIKLLNRFEHKLVYFCGEYVHESKNHVNVGQEGHSFGYDDSIFEDIKAFGRKVIDHLKATYPAFLVSPLLRLDIMQRLDKSTNNGFVINEIESLEAMTLAKVSAYIAMKLM